MTGQKNIMVSLDRLEPGEKGHITGMSLAPGMRRRLEDMGFTNGSLVECAYRSPFGDPTAYFIKGALIAIRSGEAENIQIEIGDEMGIL